MTLHPDEQARELFYELKPECQAHADGCKGCAEAIALIAALLARVWAEATEQCAIEAGERSPEGVSSHTMLGDMWDERLASLRQAAGEGTKP